MSSRRLLMDKIEEVVPNRYQAVLVAAKRARQINAERLARLQMMAEDAEIDIDYRKVTSVAIEDLLSGRIPYHKKGH